MRGLLLLPNNEWGQRVFKAFDTELKTLGGTIAAMRFYDPLRAITRNRSRSCCSSTKAASAPML